MEKRAIAPKPADGDVFRPDEAATYLRVGRSILYDEMKAGRLRWFKVGRNRLISRAALDEWVRAREAESADVGA